MNSNNFSLMDTVIHRIDPRCKIIFAVLVSFAVAVSDNYIVLIPVMIFSVVSAFAAGLRIVVVLKRLLIINLFICLIWLSLPFTAKGQVIYTVIGFNVTYQGVMKSLLITLKCNSIMLTLIVFISTISTTEIGQALSKLKFNTKLTMFIFFTYRYLGVIHLEYKRLQSAAKIRGFRPGTNLHSYKTYSYLIGNLIVRSWERAERVHQAMLCRGFNGNFYCLRKFQMNTSDIVFCFIGGGLLIIIVLGNILFP